MANVRREISGPPAGAKLVSTFSKGRARLLSLAYQARRFHRPGIFCAKPLRPLRHAARRLLWGGAPKVDGFVLVGVGRHNMWVPTDSPFLFAYLMNEYEAFTSDLYVGSLTSGSVVLDIGANVGFFTLIAAHAVGRGGHVFAFEPAPTTADVLRRNVETNGCHNVSCLAVAVGDTKGVRDLVLADCADCNSLHSHPLFPSGRTLPVECVTIDGFLVDRHVDVVKIDVEGAEISVIDGMKQTLRRNRDIRLFVELNPPCLKAAGRAPRELVGTLKENGFSIQLIDERTRQLRDLDERLLGIPIDDPGYYANLYCSRT